MSGIQILLLTLAIGAWWGVWKKYRSSAISRSAFAAWSCVWIAVSIVVIRPTLTSRVALFLGVGRGADVVVYAALALIFIFLFRFSIALEEMRREITALVRIMALSSAAPAQAYDKDPARSSKQPPQQSV